METKLTITSIIINDRTLVYSKEINGAFRDYYDYLFRLFRIFDAPKNVHLNDFNQFLNSLNQLTKLWSQVHLQAISKMAT